MKIRDLRADEYADVVRIWLESGLSFRPLGRDADERFRHEIAMETSVFLGAEEEGALIGVVLGTQDGRKGWINRLAVLPAWQRRGVAKALVAEAEQRIHALGIQIVTCLIEGHNRASEAFFGSLGYIAHPDITYYAKRQSVDW
jgi:N-acetylglutamate synthase